MVGEIPGITNCFRPKLLLAAIHSWISAHLWNNQQILSFAAKGTNEVHSVWQVATETRRQMEAVMHNSIHMGKNKCNTVNDLCHDAQYSNFFFK